MFLRLDRYIIRLFLGTYFSSILLILSVAIVFDINERISKFLNPECSLYEIVFHYYLNFVPYYANMFSPLFVFLSVIFFTSKLAEKTEIIAILASGVSFKRLLRPYLFSAAMLSLPGAVFATIFRINTLGISVKPMRRACRYRSLPAYSLTSTPIVRIIKRATTSCWISSSTIQ